MHNVCVIWFLSYFVCRAACGGRRFIDTYRSVFFSFLFLLWFVFVRRDEVAGDIVILWNVNAGCRGDSRKIGKINFELGAKLVRRCILLVCLSIGAAWFKSFSGLWSANDSEKETTRKNES